MGNWKSDPVSEPSEYFPKEDYNAIRRIYTPTEAIIPYKPAEDPAWVRHQRTLPPKPARFEKLHRWHQRSEAVMRVARWAIVVAGAATMAAPMVTGLPH